VKHLSSCRMNSLLNTKLLGNKVYCLDKTSSTQDVAKKLLDAGAQEGAVIIARLQTAGRGRRGAAWESPPGGLWMSVIFFPDKTLDAPLLTLAGAVSAAEAIKKSSGLDAKIKWPNDCLINGKKTAGVMGESFGPAVILGIGVNLNVKPGGLDFIQGREATSLFIEKKADIDENLFLGLLLRELEYLYMTAPEQGSKSIIAKMEKFCALKNKSVAGFSNGKRVEGTAAGFDEDGSIVVRLDSGIRVKFSAGDLKLEKSIFKA
jgi:BirA family transcriptional regulator, biotin operon repressor / biotin---[acetyl-CoA-carboxylase] ligase